MAGSRGAVVRLARWFAPMLGREHAQALPALRNLHDVRTWASAMKPGAESVEFAAAMSRMWREFCSASWDASELDQAAREAALAVVDLDADERSTAARWAAVMAWADAYGDRAVTSDQLRRVRGVREAIGAAMRPDRDPDAVVSGPMVASFVRLELVKAMEEGEFGDVRIEAGPPDLHNKLARWVLRSGRATFGAMA